MSLALTEKRPQQRNGGCVSIFFHLFSKKKLVSSKKQLLPSVHAAKKFGNNDKMPMAKLLLIADENRGGFPKLESGPDPGVENRMQTPSLVARLMGLESMPVVHNDRPRKALDSKFCSDGSLEHSRLDQGLCVDSVGGNGKVELRPQKLQKTGGFLESRPVEFFSKGLTSGSGKKQYMKLESPVKSPRLLSKSSTARLVQVANKILEPGLQPRSRVKCAITYIGSPEDYREVDREPMNDFLGGSCKSCGSLIGVKESLVAECGSSSSDLSNGSEECKKMKSPVIPSGQMKNGSVVTPSKLKPEEGYKMKSPVVPNGHLKNGSLAIQAKLNVESRVREVMERKQQLGNGDEQCKKFALRKDWGQKSPVVRDKVVLGTKVCSRKQAGKDLTESNGAKDFVALNIKLNNCTRSRSPTRVSDSSRVELERNGLERNMGRKRRPINRNAGAINSNSAKERSLSFGSDVYSRKGTGFISNRVVNQSCIKGDLRKVDCDSFSGSKDNGIVSFTFTSPMRCDSRSITHEVMTEKRRGQGELSRDYGQPRKLVSDARSLSSQAGKALRGDELSIILEEKIRELSSLDQDEFASGFDLQGKFTVSILEELISALTMRAPELHKNGDSRSNMSSRTDANITHNQMIDADGEFQEEAQPRITTAYQASVSDQPSPISILEASFSNGSCSLESLNGNSGGKQHLGLQEISNKTQSLDLDSDLLDSATSLNISQSGSNKVNHSMDNSSSMCGISVLETEFSPATEAISDAELLFESTSLYGSDGKESSFDSFLLDTLETMIDAFCLNFKMAKERNQLRVFLFDCMMECLDSKFSHFCRSGFKTWLKLPLTLNRDRLMTEVHVEIRGWRDLAGKLLDDLVVQDMSRSNSKWTECEAEIFEIGVETQRDILQALIDEMVIDLF